MAEAPAFSELTDDLWMGGCPHSITHGQFGSVVNLYGIHYPIDDHIPYLSVRALIDDWQLPIPERLVEALADIVNLWRRAHAPVLVHCQNGLNRSGLVAALALMRGDGMSAEDAIALLREKREARVLCNTTFEHWLLTGEHAPWRPDAKP